MLIFTLTFSKCVVFLYRHSLLHTHTLFCVFRFLSWLHLSELQGLAAEVGHGLSGTQVRSVQWYKVGAGL